MAINPTKRIRDGVRYFKPQEKVSFEEWEQVCDRASRAKSFIRNDNLIYTTLIQSLKDIELIILENRIKEVREEHVVTDTFKKIFITPKKIQDDELVGQYKFIKGFLAELQSWVDFKKELEKKEAEGVISIERNRE